MLDWVCDDAGAEALMPPRGIENGRAPRHAGHRVAQALAILLVTVLAAGAAAQDRPIKTKPKASQPAKRRVQRRRKPATKKKAQRRRSKKERDAAHDALFSDDDKASKRKRRPVSTKGPWPAEDDSPWRTEDDSPWPAEDDSPWPAEERVSAEEEEELFGDLDEDMESPPGKREAEHRGSTHPSTIPSPDGIGYRISTRVSPDVLDWEEGADIPPGYEPDTRVRKGLVIAGAITFGLSWMASAAYGSYLIEEREGEMWRSRDEDEAPSEAVLYVPLVGPWIALGTVEHDRRERGAFISGGIVQAAGMAMLIGGLAARETVLVKTDDAEVAVLPQVGPTGNGVTLHGSF
jgi:hypothetical protein